MPAYCDVDGVPCHASRELLTTILRDEWGFDGIVASDYMAVEMLVGQHRLTGDLGTAAGDGAAAGRRRELPSTAAYGAPLLAAIEDGRVAEARVDLAVERVLRLKLRLGLFERPYVDPPTPDGSRRSTPMDEGARWPRARPAVDRAASRTTASCRCRRTAAGSPWSGRSPTAPATSSATTATCSTSRPSPSCATGRTRSASRRATSSRRREGRPADDPAARSATGSVTSASCTRRGTGLRDGTDEEIAEAVGARRATPTSRSSCSASGPA